MSYTQSDRVGGKKVRITYNAAQLIFPRRGSRWELTKSVTEHQRDNRSKFAISIRRGGEQDGVETWFAADGAGVSIAAAIFVWILETNDLKAGEEQESLPENFNVVLPLETRVYFCSIADHVIVEEHMLTQDLAIERLQKIREAGETVYAFGTGPEGNPPATQAPVAKIFPVQEKCPFKPTEFAFRRSWWVFARSGMLHRAHVVFLLVIAGALASTYYSSTAVQYLAETGPLKGIIGMIWKVETVEETQELTVITPQVPHSTPDEMRYIARQLIDAETLYADGLTELTFTGSSIVLKGNSRGSYPYVAKGFSDRNNGEWRLDSKGWNIVLQGSPPQKKKAPEIDADQVLRTMTSLPIPLNFVSGPSLITGVRIPGSNTVTRPLQLSTYGTELGNTAIGSLVELADRMGGLPGSLTRATCQFGKFRLTNCSVSVQVRSL